MLLSDTTSVNTHSGILSSCAMRVCEGVVSLGVGEGGGSYIVCLGGGWELG